MDEEQPPPALTVDPRPATKTPGTVLPPGHAAPLAYRLGEERHTDKRIHCREARFRSASTGQTSRTTVASSRLAVLLVLAALAGGGCGGNGTGDTGPGEESGSAKEGAARLTARPDGGAGDCKPGLRELSLPGGGKALLRVGPGAAGERRAFILALHGAGGTPRNALWAFRGANDEPVVLLAPAAGDDGWSLSRSGRDVARIDRALAEAFDRCRIDREHVAIGGFSAGASYALSLGLVNGDLFDAVIALSPGGIVTEAREGSPRIFVAHGTRDRRIPIEDGAGTIVPRLRSAGYSVDLRRFDGGHEVPRNISEAAISWFLER